MARALDERAPFTRRAVGPDAVAMRVGRALLPAGLFQRMVAKVLGIRVRVPSVTTRSDSRPAKPGVQE